MPNTKGQKMLFAFITVLITVHLFVFYNLSYVNGLTLDMLESYGVPIFGIPCKIWMVILAEFCCAYLLEIFVGSPFSMRIAFRIAPPAESKPFVVETAIICATVAIMCPLMSLIAVFLYNDLGPMNFWGFCATWLRTVMHNFPLAFFSQIFFILPAVRKIFGWIMRLHPQSATCAQSSKAA